MFCTINSQFSTGHQLSTIKAKNKWNTNIRNAVSTKALTRASFLRTKSRSTTRTNRIRDQTRQKTTENAWGRACKSDDCSWSPQKPNKKKTHQRGHSDWPNYEETAPAAKSDVGRRGWSRRNISATSQTTQSRHLCSSGPCFPFVVFLSSSSSFQPN